MNAVELTRAQILAHRRRAGNLDRRLPSGPDALRRAAHAGLQDSMPRAALLSIHARVEAAGPSTWEDPSLVQLWGPRFSVYVVAARDRGVFTLGRLPDSGAGHRRALDMADRLEAFLAGRTMPYAEAGHSMGLKPNELRYAAPTGRVLMRWDGARQPVIWAVPAPDMDPFDARLELARRFLHILGPGTATSFADWAGIRTQRAVAAFEALDGSLIPVRTPVGDGQILAIDEASFRTGSADAAAGVRLLPSGDAYWLRWGDERRVLVPDAGWREKLWTARVWPGALLVDGELVGTWRREGTVVTIDAWRELTSHERESVGAEARSLPLPGIAGTAALRWLP